MTQIIDLTLTLPRNPNKPFHPRSLNLLEYVVWHHTVSPTDQTPTAIARFHISKGWSGIGYNFLCYVDGTIYKVRPIGVVPACVQGENTKSVCIAFVGNFQENPPPAVMVASGVWLTNLLRKAYPTIKGVRGHQEMPGQATSCPGNLLLPELTRLRSEEGWAA